MTAGYQLLSGVRQQISLSLSLFLSLSLSLRDKVLKHFLLSLTDWSSKHYMMQNVVILRTDINREGASFLSVAYFSIWLTIIYTSFSLSIDDGDLLYQPPWEIFTAVYSAVTFWQRFSSVSSGFSPKNCPPMQTAYNINFIQSSFYFLACLPILCLPLYYWQ